MHVFLDTYVAVEFLCCESEGEIHLAFGFNQFL